MLTPAQCRAARALIEWSREDLAAASKAGVRTIIDFERGAREPREITKQALQSAFERAGVTFPGDGCVCLKSPVQPSADLGAADGQ